MEALRKEMEIEKAEVYRRTPLDTGALRASLKLIMGGESKRSVAATIIAGGENVNPKTNKTTAQYAAIVHEALETHFHVGGPKFIESTLRASEPHMAARVAKRMDMRRIFA